MAVEENLLTQFELLAASEHVHRLADPDVVAFERDIPFALFNAISGARFEAGTEAQRTAEVADSYIERGRPTLWWATPSTMTPRGDAVLRTRGFVRNPEPGMHRPLDRPVTVSLPDDLRVDVTAMTPDLMAALAEGFGFPEFVVEPMLAAFTSIGGDQFAHVVARLDGEPVGGGSLFFSGLTAGIYNIATVEGARRRGIGTAVTGTLINVAMDRGCTDAVLMASDMGRPTYERLGFVEVCQTPQYLWTPES